MRSRDRAIALLIVTIWGLNFVFIHVALRALPPLLLSAVRFFLTVFPAIFFVRRPRIPVATLALFGLSAFGLQFAFLFTGMKAGVPAGLASLLLQVQVFFTIALSMRIFGDHPPIWSWIGAVFAFCGVGSIALSSAGEVSPLGIVLVLLAALSWAVSNVAAKRAGSVNPLALVVWGSAFAFPPLLGLSLAVDGPGAIGPALRGVSLETIGALAYMVYGSTLVGCSLWAALLRRHAPSSVAPMTLLVPVTGMASTALLLGEPLPGWKLGAAGLVLAGVALSVFGARVVGAVRILVRAAPATE